MRLKVLIFAAVGILAVAAFIQFQKNNNSKFEAPRQETPEINYTIKKNTSLDAVIGDLKYYNFIKDEASFRYALEHSEDKTPGYENSLKIGNNTIDRETSY